MPNAYTNIHTYTFSGGNKHNNTFTYSRNEHYTHTHHGRHICTDSHTVTYSPTT